MATHTIGDAMVDRPTPPLRERPARDRAGLPVLGLSLLALLGGTGLLIWSRVVAGHGVGSFSCAWTPPSMRPWRAGPGTSCAAPTRKSSSCCTVPWPKQGGCRTRPATGHGGADRPRWTPSVTPLSRMSRKQSLMGTT